METQKVAVILRTDLEPWKRLNVTAFTISGLAALPRRGRSSVSECL